MSKIDQARLNLMDRYWKAANYLTVGQIYLQDNPLLKEPLRSRAHQTAITGTLGNLTRLELHLRSFEPTHQRSQCQYDLPSRTRPRRTCHPSQCLS